jgi:deoxyribodipyrimidine photo-lyase
MKTELSIFWLRRDLRLEDNHGLLAALKSSVKVLIIFIFDPNILDKLAIDDARVHFIHSQLDSMHKYLKQNFNSGLSIYYDTPVAVFERLSESQVIKTVYTNSDYEPYAIERDTAVADLLQSKGINFSTHKDQVIFEKSEITKEDGTAYKVYTPYANRWINNFKESYTTPYPSEKNLTNLVKNFSFESITLQEIGFKLPQVFIAPYNIDRTIVDQYEAVRNFPAIKGTSRLGPHLRFGTISVRKVVSKAIKSANNTFLKELIWREFFMQILWHYPHTVTKSFKPQYDNIKWRNNTEEFKKWCDGETGYPFVDAGMKELNQTGFMHNRVRMLVGSFLCKHLLIDWRWGEAYFAKKLHDFELSSNVSNWQWVAGCGVDAAPYFRIFNPTTQILKFDKDKNYLKKWVPDYDQESYAKPIVEHKFARERCLNTFKAALGK